MLSWASQVLRLPDRFDCNAKARKRFRFGPSVVCTSLSLPSLQPAAGDDAREAIRIEATGKGAPPDVEWCHHWRDGEEIALSLARQGADYWVRSPEVGDFLLQMESGRILVAADTAADAATLEHLLLDQVLPRLLAQQGHLLIHASALDIDGRGALFTGPSGWGKSTLAALLHRHGHAVLSDDCVQLTAAVEGFQAVPTYPSLRLYPDSLGEALPGAGETAPVASYSEKLRVPVAAQEEGNAVYPVDALYLLGEPAEAGEAIRIMPLRPAETCQALLRHSFKLDVGDRAANAHQFALCGAVARAIPAFRLDYPRDFSRAGELVRHITGHLASLPTRD